MYHIILEGYEVNEVRTNNNPLARANRARVIAQRSHSEPRSLDLCYDPKVMYAIYRNEVYRQLSKMAMIDYTWEQLVTRNSPKQT